MGMPAPCCALQGSEGFDPALHSLADPPGVFPKGETLLATDAKEDMKRVGWLPHTVNGDGVGVTS